MCWNKYFRTALKMTTIIHNVEKYIVIEESDVSFKSLFDKYTNLRKVKIWVHVENFDNTLKLFSYLDKLKCVEKLSIFVFNSNENRRQVFQDCYVPSSILFPKNALKI